MYMSFFQLGAAKVFLILGTAVLQALTILLFFMRLRLESRLIWIFAGRFPDLAGNLLRVDTQ
jgi:hypothetical protein